VCCRCQFSMTSFMTIAGRTSTTKWYVSACHGDIK
jgi:hypothetical protein